MRHLYLYVEGLTEQTFASTVLTPHLAPLSVYLMGSQLAEFGRNKRRVSRGGVARYEPFQRGLRNLLKQHDRPGVTVSTMIDLYALPTDFPGWAEADKLRSDPYARVACLEAALAADINPNPDRFVPHIQLHEYEAMLFAYPEQMSLFYPDRSHALAELREIADAHRNPELVDDGKDTAPSKRIIRHLPEYEDAKVFVGSQVAELIGLPAIRDKCPHFSAWVTRLEQLGQPAVPPASGGE